MYLVGVVLRFSSMASCANTRGGRVESTSACQGGRRGDVMVHRVLKFLSFALLFLFVIFSFSIVVKEFVKCRS